MSDYQGGRVSAEETDETAQTWRDYCKHDGPCHLTAGDRCAVPDDAAYIARMELRYPPGDPT